MIDRKKPTVLPPTEEECDSLRRDAQVGVAGARSALGGDAQALAEWREQNEVQGSPLTSTTRPGAQVPTVFCLNKGAQSATIVKIYKLLARFDLQRRIRRRGVVETRTTSELNEYMYSSPPMDINELPRCKHTGYQWCGSALEQREILVV
jgi:hypothetical protein